MPKTKISEYSSVNANNTDIGGIDIDENCLPSNLNDSVREVMVHLKNMQTGASGDTFTFASLNATTANIDGGTIDGATIGGTTPAAGAFTTLSASSTVSGTGFSNYLASPPAIGGTAAAAGSFTNLSYTGTLTGGTGVINIGSGQLYKDASGNVGIGTSSPARKLHVSGGSFQVDYDYSVSGTSFRILNDATPANGVNLVAEYYGSGAYGPIKFTTGNTERMRIDSSGNLLVGTTSLTANNTKSTFFDALQGYQSIHHSTENTSGNYFIGFAYNGSYIGSITQNGTTATAYNTSSDYRLKEDVSPMTGALAKNELLNPVTYKWKADGSDGQGFIAHELQAVFPDAVTGEKDAVDDEGKPVYQGVDTSFLVGHLVACVKELTAELNNVKAELAAMKGSA